LAGRWLTLLAGRRLRPGIGSGGRHGDLRVDASHLPRALAGRRRGAARAASHDQGADQGGGDHRSDHQERRWDGNRDADGEPSGAAAGLRLRPASSSSQCSNSSLVKAGWPSAPAAGLLSDRVRVAA
jgi:hypothetical protein